MVSISSSVRGISRTFYTPLYEKEMVKNDEGKNTIFFRSGY